MNIEKAFVEYKDYLNCQAIKFVKNRFDAEDLVQETYFRAYKFKHTFVENGNMRVWLCKILRNQAINLYNSNFRIARKHLAFVKLAPTSMELELTPNSINKLILDAIGSLSINHRAAIKVVDIELNNYKDACVILNIPQGTLMSRLHRARHSLREKLKTYHEQI